MSKASLELGGGNWGTKDGNLLAYAQGNESSNLVPREFTFTRGSDIAATRINSSGVIEKYRENLLLQSNQFDTTWTTSNASVTSGQSGYDGSSDAWLLESTATTTSMRLQQGLTSSSILSYSVYAKKGTADWLSLRSNSSTTAVWFDLSNGVIGQENTDVIDSSIESIGDGWYRLSVIFSSCTSVRLYVTDGDNVFTTTLGDNIYIQDAQLEQGLVATSYLESGATTATSGVADNEPRIDYTGGTGSLLLEPSRTNDLPFSEGFSSGWLTSGINYSSSYIISPEGVSNATTIVENSSNSNHRIQDVVTVNTGATYTFSIFVKAINGTRNFFVNVSPFQFRAYFNLQAGEVTSLMTGASASIEPFGNGWYRCIVVGTTTTASGGHAFRIGMSDGTTESYQGDGESSIALYGAQLEEGSYPTSYIPTYGTSVTRNADSLGKYDLADSTSQTVFFQFKNVGYAGGGGEIVIEKANPVAAIFRIYAQATSGGVVLVQFRTEFPIQTYTFNTGKQTSEVQKVAFSISGTTAKAYCNGQLKHTFTVTETEMQVLNWRVQNTKYNTDKLLLFPTALTDRELVDLTSPYSTYQELVTAEGLTWESPTCTTNSITELQSI